MELLKYTEKCIEERKNKEKISVLKAMRDAGTDGMKSIIMILVYDETINYLKNNNFTVVPVPVIKLPNGDNGTKYTISWADARETEVKKFCAIDHKNGKNNNEIGNLTKKCLTYKQDDNMIYGADGEIRGMKGRLLI